MAERGPRSGQKITFEPDADLIQRNLEENDPPEAGEAPGAQTSPQHPGEVPDRSSIPGQYTKRVPRATQVRRSLAEDGTAQAIMGVYQAKPGEELNPARFEQATASYEELRKAYPAQLPPTRPAPGYALATGDATASEDQAIGGPFAAPPAPYAVPGSVSMERPGGGTAAVAEPTRTDAPAGQVGSAFTPGDMLSGSPAPSAATTTSPKSGGTANSGESPRAAAPPAPGDVTGVGGTLPAAESGQADAGQGRGAGAAPTSVPRQPAEGRRTGSEGARRPDGNRGARRRSSR